MYSVYNCVWSIQITTLSVATYRR